MLISFIGLLLVFYYLCSINCYTMSQEEKRYSLHQLQNAICIASEIEQDELFGCNKNMKHTIARGVFYMLAREYGYLFCEIGSYANRHHSTCVNVSKRFIGYYEVKDKMVCNIVDKVKSILSKKQYE